MKELVHLQFGNFANFVGAHFWNLEDEENGKICSRGSSAVGEWLSTGSTFRITETNKGEAFYQPRLVLFDLPGSMGSMGLDGSVGQVIQERLLSVDTWDGHVRTCRRARVEPSAYLQKVAEEDPEELGDVADPAQDSHAGVPDPLEEAAAELSRPGGVRYWTDFCKASLHPRTPHILHGAWSATEDWAGGFGEGAAAFNGEAVDQALDRVRFFVEECDQMQGFQVLAEDLSGWGSVASRLLAELRDCFGPAPIAVFSVRPPSGGGHPSESGRRAACGKLGPCLSLASLAEDVGLYVPLQAPEAPLASRYLRWDPGSAFQTSALCAAAVEAVTTPMHLGSGGSGALDLGGALRLLSSAPGGQPPSALAAVGCLSAAMPAPTVPRPGAASDARQRPALASVA
eukprot:CAMPEP_0177608190 /NCGR_PEP_ID=MMETSP0419_2-20121207/18331_1 /TAXON_ID=582737 /ORGANISM="Tetraselmis sp., Strain GSL018" /LENGTH=399 /DNA_ID=CAMNT_0019102847 /DNA_START=15 /DNA_END=1211 /DNA_ORIENTATION=+